MFSYIIVAIEKMPLVSVIIPNYNHARYLEQRIESVLNQTFSNFEVIILDDKSNDGSQEFISKYKSHPKVSHIVLNEDNSGSTFKQWQKGLELAQGEYIWFAESDDWATNVFLEELVIEFQKRENIGIAYCNSAIVNEKGQVIGDYAKHREDLFKSTRWEENYLNDGRNEIAHYLIKNMTINNMSAALLRKDLVLKNIEKVKTYRNAGDVLLCILILMESDVFYLSKALNFYRDHNANATKANTVSGLVFLENLKLYTYVLNMGNVTKEWLKLVKVNGLQILLYKYHFYHFPNKIILDSFKINPEFGFQLLVSKIKENLKKLSK